MVSRTAAAIGGHRRSGMRHLIVKLGLSLLAAIVTGCASIETGPGSMGSRADPVNFNLKSSDAVSGSMNTAVPDEDPSAEQFF
jgi:hypothetical protein